MSLRKLLRGSAYTTAGQAILIAASALLTPLVVRQLRPSSYGLLAFLNALIGYLGYADLGMGIASTQFASQEQARRNPRRESQVIWTGLGLSLGVGLLVSAAIAADAPLICDRFLHLEAVLRPQGIWMLRIVAGAFLLKNVAAVLNTPQLVRLRFDTYTAITSGGALAQIILTPTVLFLGGDLIAVAAMIAILNLTVMVLHFVVGRKLLPELWPPAIDKRLIKPLFTFGGTTVFSALVELVLTGADRMMLAYFVSVAAVGFYSLGYTYASLAVIVAIGIAQVLFPMFSQLQSLEDRAELRALFGRSATLMWLALVPIAVLLAVLTRPVLDTFLGLLYSTNSVPLAHVLLVGMLFSGMAYMPVQLLFASGKAITVARYRSAELLPYLVAIPVLTLKYGIMGAAVAWALRAFADSIALYLILDKAEFPGLLADLARSGSIVGVLLPPLLLLWLAPAQWLWQASVTTVCLLAYVLLVWRLVLTPGERNWLVAIPKRLLMSHA